ncbi:MAG: OsmC family protein [Thermomicrobiales bacterium]
MSTLREFLGQKREALLARRADAEANPPTEPHVLRANVKAEGRSGVRRIRIREFQILSDSGPELAGYSFGPGSPEIQLGVLGSCLTHIFEIQAALNEVVLDSLEVEITGNIDPRAGKPGFENVPFWPHNINYVVTLESPESDERIAFLHAEVERTCPILNLLLNPQTIEGVVVNKTAALAGAAAD